jgi:N-acetylglucosamine-6-phosphate deacetylase
MLALTPDWLFDGETMAQGLTVLVEGDRIVGVSAQDVEGAVQLGSVLAPGFIDVQVNGGGGVLFNDAPTLATLRAIATAHHAFGVTGIMPTLISDDRSRMVAALEAVGAAIAQGVDGILGLHLEGPWLSAPPRKAGKLRWWGRSRRGCPPGGPLPRTRPGSPPAPRPTNRHTP